MTGCVRIPVVADPALDAKAQMLDRLTQVFGRVNSVLTLRPIKVKVNKKAGLPAPAWSDADSVTFNACEIGDLTDVRDLAWLKGLDYHELAHILYTPRTGSELVQWVKDNGYWQAFNGLEDMRIETLLTGRYPSIVPWLQATIARYFLTNPENFQYSYSLLRGRRYLDVAIRQESRRAWHDPSTLDELIEVVDAYRDLVFPNDTEVAKDLIERYAKLMPKSNDDGTGQGGEGQGEDTGQGGQGGKVLVIDPFGHGGRPTEGISSSSSRPESAKNQQKDKAKADRLQVEDFDEVIVLDKPQSDSEPVDDDSDTGDTPSDSDGSETPSEASDSDSDSDADGDDSESGDTGESAGQGISNAVADLLADAVEDLFADADIAKELENLVRQVQGLPTLDEVAGGALPADRWEEQPVDAQTFDVARVFARELERIKASTDPAWESFESAGRLAPIRYERGDDYKTVFDRWTEGRADATDIECVIALDVSGSMSSHQTNAFQAMWAIKRGLDRIEAKTSVVTFESTGRVLYNSSDKANTQMRVGIVGGGTDPMSSLQFATNQFARSDKAIKLLFVITDGEWSNAEVSDELIAKMRKSGVITSFAYIGGYDPSSSHNCEIAHRVTDARELVGLGKKLVRLAIARKLANN